MDMTDEAWRMMLQQWPKELPRQGLIQTKQNDQIPFINFRTHSTLLLIDRGKPDAQGARKVILPMNQIAALKLAGTHELSAFEGMGFADQSF